MVPSERSSPPSHSECEDVVLPKEVDQNLHELSLSQGRRGRESLVIRMQLGAQILFT